MLLGVGKGMARDVSLEGGNVVTEGVTPGDEDGLEEYTWQPVTKMKASRI